jgi:hypothetical protein
MGQRCLLVALLALGAVGCGRSANAQSAPVCTDVGGCPAGSRCVDGVRCQQIGCAPAASDAPRGTPSTIAPSDPPRLNVPAQTGDGGRGLDAGSGTFDSGPTGFDSGTTGFDSGPTGFDAGELPRPGCDACVR